MKSLVNFINESINEGLRFPKTDSENMQNIVYFFKKVNPNDFEKLARPLMEWAEDNLESIDAKKLKLTEEAYLGFLVSSKSNKVLEVIFTRPSKSSDVEFDSLAIMESDEMLWYLKDKEGLKSFVNDYKRGNKQQWFKIPMEDAFSIWKTKNINVGASPWTAR